MSGRIIKPGERFGKLVVIERAERKFQVASGVRWVCRCDCGKIVLIPSSQLARKNISGCDACTRGHSEIHSKRIATAKKIYNARAKRTREFFG